MDSDIIKEQLKMSLRGGNAFRPMKDIIENFPEDRINKKIPGVDYTPYQLIEHMRIAQWDILEFTKDQKHSSPDWPEGYWPDKSFVAEVEDWDKSAKQFFTDLTEIERIISDETIDLTDMLPESEDYTYLREILLILAHGSYHLGQLVLFSKANID